MRLRHVLESSAPAEMNGVGNKGIAGISAFMGGDLTPASRLKMFALDQGGPMTRPMLPLGFARAGRQSSISTHPSRPAVLALYSARSAAAKVSLTVNRACRAKTPIEKVGSSA